MSKEAMEEMIPAGLSEAEVAASACELGEVVPAKVLDFDVVVVGAGASGVPAAGFAAELGAKVALLQKEATVVSQGNCGSAMRLACGHGAASRLCRSFRRGHDVAVEPCGNDD